MRNSSALAALLLLSGQDGVTSREAGTSRMPGVWKLLRTLIYMVSCKCARGCNLQNWIPICELHIDRASPIQLSGSLVTLAVELKSVLHAVRNDISMDFELVPS